jgi:hypothetical protein
VIRLLRLFPQFRALEADRDAQVVALRESLQEENQRALLLQDRLDSAQESVARLWGMVDDAQKRAYRAMEMQVNFATQQRFGITPYPEAAQLPPSMEPDLDADHTVRRRMMPSEAIAAQTRRLRDQVVERLMPKATA